jgi:hypothetical protein
MKQKIDLCSVAVTENECSVTHRLFNVETYIRKESFKLG